MDLLTILIMNKLKNASGKSGATMNLFIQNSEPETFNGIWIKSDTFTYDDIIETSSKNNLTASAINILKGSDYETIIYNSDITLNYSFSGIYLTNADNEVLYDIPVYYGDSTEWIDITPSLYTELEYIQSSGSQFIDTIIPLSTTANEGNTKMELKVKMEQTDSTERVILGSNSNSALWFIAYNGSKIVYANNNYNWNYSLSEDQKVSPFIISSDVANLYIDGVQIGSNYRTNSIFRFFKAPDNFSSNLGIYNLYYCKIWDKDNNLVASFIPVKDGNNEVCLYEEINEEFYYNSGTGTFIAGPEI